MNYTKLSIEERCCLRKYYNEGNSLRKIAELANGTKREPHRGSFFVKSFLECSVDYSDLQTERHVFFHDRPQIRN